MDIILQIDFKLPLSQKPNKHHNERIFKSVVLFRNFTDATIKQIPIYHDLLMTLCQQTMYRLSVLQLAIPFPDINTNEKNSRSLSNTILRHHWLHVEQLLLRC
jgi:hypothetical protein